MIVTKSIRVDRPVEVAFKVFTEEIGAWWPLREGFSFGGDRAKDMFLEGRVGGRVFERFTDGEEYTVGAVTAYTPPELVAFTWREPDWDGPTQVEVRFTADGDGTRVDLTHSGWERIGADAEQSASSYDGGWAFVLERYAKH